MADKLLKDLPVIPEVTGSELIPVSVLGIDENKNVPIHVMLGGSLIYRGQCHSFDDIYGMGIYMHMNTESDYPGINPYGMLIVLGAAGMSVQLYMNTSSVLYIRQYSSGSWSDWKQISFT